VIGRLLYFEFVIQFQPVPEVKPVVSPKGNYGQVQLKPFSFLLDPELLMVLETSPVPSSVTL